MHPQSESPPDYLPADAQVWWPALIAELAARGTLKRVTKHRLAIYCQLFAQYHRVTRTINEEGQTQTLHGFNGEVKDKTIAPEALQQEKLVKVLRYFDKEFGFLEEAKEADPLEALREKLSARLAATPHVN